MAVTGQIGDADVRLENAAEEATMQKILEALGGLNNSAGNGNTGIGSLLKKTTPLGIAMGAVTGSFSLLGTAIKGTVKGLGSIIKAGNAVVGFSAGLIESQSEITGFTETISKSRLNILGFGDSIHAITKLLYGNYQTFQQLSTSGIAFGNQLERMRSFATGAGINLDQLAGNLAANSEELARLGTGTRGARMAVDAARIAFQQNEEVLQRYGLSYAEQNENFLAFFSRNALAMQRGTISQQQVINLSDDYAKGLRRLSELTGIQADQLKEGVDKANMNTAFKNFISQFDGETQNRLNSILDTYQAGFGDAGREAAMATMMGVNPVTEGAQQLTSMMPGFGAQLQSLNSQARNFNGSLEDFNNSMYGQMNQFANASRGFADANSRYFGSLALMGDPYGMAGSEIVRFVNMFGGSVSDLTSNLGTESPTQRVFNSFNRAVRDVRDALANLFADVFESGTFTTAMSELALKIPTFKDKIVEFINFFRTYDYDSAFENLKNYNPFDEQGRQNIYDSAEEMLTNLGNKIYEWWDTTGREIFERIGGTIADAITNERSGMLPSFLGATGITGGSGNQIDDIVNRMREDPSSVSDEERDQLVMFIREQFRQRDRDSDSFLRNLRGYLGGITGKVLGADYLEDLTGSGRSSLFGFGDDDALLRKLEESGYYDGERRVGTRGALGRMTEPKTTLAKIHAGERVLNPQEAAEYNAMGTTATAGVGAGNSLVEKLLDETKQSRVQLVNALNTLHVDMRELQRKQENTISAIENYV